MIRIQKEVLAAEPDARLVRMRHSEPDARFVVMAGLFRQLGWGCNRLQAWKAAHQLVKAGGAPHPEFVIWRS